MSKKIEESVKILNKKFNETLYSFPESEIQAIYLEFKKQFLEKPTKVIKRQTKEKSDISEIKTKDKYKGEASPYWEYLEKTGDYNQEHGASEALDGNPDKLSETDGLYLHEVFLDPEQVEMVENAWHLLTPKQRNVLTLVGLEGKTLENAGVILGINKANVLHLIERARKIILENATTL